jgi:hypothetical protein
MLEPVEHRPAIHHRHVDVERDRVRLVLVGEVDPLLPVERDDPEEPLLARHVEHDVREVEVVLDDQDDPVARLNLRAVIRDARTRRTDRCRARRLRPLPAGRGRLPCRLLGGRPLG